MSVWLKLLTWVSQQSPNHGASTGRVNMVHRHFSIHGDNIVECERTLNLIERALTGRSVSTEGPSGSVTNPSFRLVMDGGQNTLEFVFFPGFGRWDGDIRQLIRNKGGVIREAPDVIISEVTSGQEYPLLAIEYSGALAAGNQAWQRNGRAYSCGLAHIPYLYVAEIGGFELDASRTRKASRLPNPAIPFSYLTFSSWIDTPVLPVYVPNPGLDEASRRNFASIMGDHELIDMVRLTILMEDSSNVVATLREKAFEFVQRLASGGRRGRTLTPLQWRKAYEIIRGSNQPSLVTYLLEGGRLEWSKTAYIRSLTETAKTLMRLASRFGIGLTSSNLPMSLISSEHRKVFAQSVAEVYPKLSDDFLDWLQNEGPLTVCWVMGFKPRGDDARPDRGLPPLARMLVGPNVDMLTVVYGPAKASRWQLLNENPRELARQNGLWESVMATSNAVLVDSSTDNVTCHGFLQGHWADAAMPEEVALTGVQAVPQQIGENDVDTAIHTLLARLGGPQVFEGLCNPPGGDWSGVSILVGNQTQELRWLSLPRVSGVSSKRPDHVFQFFDLGHGPIVLAVESKDMPGSIEQDIGPRLKKYMIDLLGSPATAEKMTGGSREWRNSRAMIKLDEFRFASAAACIVKGGADLADVNRKSNTDLLFGLRFTDDGKACEIDLFPSTDIGSQIAGFISEFVLCNSGISIRIRQ